MLFSVRNGLKEDALVEIPNTLAIPQFMLTICLFILLIGWLVTFTYLALRPLPEKQVELTEQKATLLVRKSPAMQALPMPPRTTGIRPVTQQTPIVTVSVDSRREMVLDHSKH